MKRKQSMGSLARLEWIERSQSNHWPGTNGSTAANGITSQARNDLISFTGVPYMRCMYRPWLASTSAHCTVITNALTKLKWSATDWTNGQQVWGSLSTQTGLTSSQWDDRSNWKGLRGLTGATTSSLFCLTGQVWRGCGRLRPCRPGCGSRACGVLHQP